MIVAALFYLQFKKEDFKMNTIRTEKLSARDFITIGIFAAINLVIFFVVGAAAGLTLIGTLANIPKPLSLLRLRICCLFLKSGRREHF